MNCRWHPPGPCWARRCEGGPAVFSSWPLAFSLRRYPPSDAEHHVLVLQGPGVQHGETDDYAWCHQWLTNQIAEAPLHWRHEPTSVYQVSVTDTSCEKPPRLQCLHDGSQEGPCFCTVEQDRHYQCLVQV